MLMVHNLRKIDGLDLEWSPTMIRIRLLSTILTFVTFSLPVVVQADEHPLAGIPLRNIGPALTSGRVSDFAFHPGQSQIVF